MFNTSQYNNSQYNQSPEEPVPEFSQSTFSLPQLEIETWQPMGSIDERSLTASFPS